jgi:hypothetical protein
MEVKTEFGKLSDENLLYAHVCGNDGQLSKSNNLYLMLTEVNPKQY